MRCKKCKESMARLVKQYWPPIVRNQDMPKIIDKTEPKWEQLKYASGGNIIKVKDNEGYWLVPLAQEDEEDIPIINLLTGMRLIVQLTTVIAVMDVSITINGVENDK